MDIVKLQNVSLSIVKQVANRLKNNKILKDRPRFGRPQVNQRENVRKAFPKDPTLKMTEFAKKKISVATVSRRKEFMVSVGSFGKAFRTFSR